MTDQEHYTESTAHVGFPLIWAVLRPTHGSFPIDPLIDIPKGISSKMTLEVAARGLKIFTSYSRGPNTRIDTLINFG